MTESSIFDPGHSQHPKPDIKNKPAGRGALAFNPLHPSMELPPEQLIRLLGMESKKTRKHLKMRNSSNQQKSRHTIDEQKTQPSPDHQNARCATDEHTPQDPQQSHRVADEQKTHRPPPSQGAQKKTTDRQLLPKPQQVAPPSHPLEYERNQPAVFHKRGPGWLLPALVTGLVAGVTISASLFWYQSPPTTAKQKAPASVVSSEPQNRRIPKQQPNNQRVKRKEAPGGTKTATLPAPAKATRTGNDANRQAALKAEQNRLRNAAEQRLTERLTRIKVNRELADLQAPPADEHTPAAATTLSAAAEPAFDQAVANQPAPADAESPSGEETAVEMIQADETEPVPETLPAVAPAQVVGSDRNGGMLEESTGFVDSFEQDTASDVAATVEQDSESNIAPSLDVNTTTALTPPTEQDTVSDVTSSSGDDMDAGQSISGTSDKSSPPAPEDSALF